MGKSLRLRVRPEVLAVARLDAGSAVPEWATSGALWSISRSENELSIVCGERFVPDGHSPVERGWRALELEGPIPFGLTGILASVLDPLAAAGIGIFAFSTFDTDYILVKSADIAPAIAALRDVGHVLL